MFGMTGQTGLLLRDDFPMKGAHCRFRTLCELRLRMTADALDAGGPAKGLVAACALGHIRVMSAQVSGSPQGLWIAKRAPAQQGDEDKCRHCDDWDGGSGERQIGHRSQPAEVESPDHVHRREHEKHQRHRGMNRLPHSERFILRSHPMQAKIDFLGSQSLFVESPSSVVERPEREIMDALSHDSTDDDHNHCRQCEQRHHRMHVRARMEKDQERTDHSRHHVDLKPTARPPMVPTHPLLDWVYENQQDDPQSYPAQEVPLPSMGKR